MGNLAKAVLAVEFLTLGCGLPDVEYRTRRFEIAPYFDYPVCEGTARTLDEFTDRLEQQMGFAPSTQPIRFYWGAEGVEEHCDVDWADGCFQPDRHRGIYAGTLSVFRHEVVHALGARVGFATPFIEEGIAVSLSDTAVLHADFSRRPVDTIAINYKNYIDAPDLVDIATASHFVTFLFRKYGIPKIMEIKDLAPDGSSAARVNEAFESVLGISLDAAEAEWRIESSGTYPYLQEGCETAPIAWDEDRIDLNTTLDCNSAETMGPLVDFASTGGGVESGMFKVVTIDILRPTKVKAEVNGDASIEVLLEACGCANVEVTSGRLLPGQPIEMDLGTCRWRATLVTHQTQPVDISLWLTRGD